MGFKSSVTIYNSDPSFLAVVDYLSEHCLTQTTSGNASLQATTHVKKWRGKDFIKEYLGVEDKEAPTFEFRPESDASIHQVLFKGKTVYLERVKSSNTLMGGEKPFTPEHLTLTIWGGGHQSLLKELLNEAIKTSFVSKSGNHINIYTQCSSKWMTSWELAMTKNGRTKDR
jgi:hypothetical protein